MKSQTNNSEIKNNKKSSFTLPEARSIGSNRKVFSKNGRTNYSSFVLFR